MNTWVIENYKHTKRVRKEFEIKNLSGYHDFYAQNNTLLLADVFESFQTKCIGIYSLDPVHFLSASKLPKSRIRATNWHWYVINDKKRGRGGLCHIIHQYAKANNKYMKDYDKNKDP